MAHPYDALYFREIMGRMLARDSGDGGESFHQAFLVAPIREAWSKEDQREVVRRTRIHMWENLEFGEVFYISPEITGELVRLADDLAKPPKRLYHFQPEDFPALRGTFYFDGHIDLPTAYPKSMAPPETRDRLRAITWGQLLLEGEPAPVGKVIYTYVDNQRLHGQGLTSPWVARHWIPLRYGQRLEPGGMIFNRSSLNEYEKEELSEEEVDWLLARQQEAGEKLTRLLYVLNQFLQTEIIAKPRHDIPPDHGRALKKSGRPLPLFRTVVLRRSISIGEKSELGQGPDWTHRWKVRSHWRKQRVGPGREMIRPTLVTEHWKGPEHLPQDQRETVQAVVR